MPPVPDWLKLHDGSLRPGLGEDTVLAMLGGEPQYRLDVRPAEGKFTCAITETVSGRRLDDGIIFPTTDEALAGGLEQLRTKLGW
jgi:hypothetical protein